MTRYLIVGAGLAGHRAAIELRRLAPAAEITLLGEEDVLPYDRPPLSKAALQADGSHGTLKDADRYEALDIAFHASTRAVAIDREARTVRAEDGRTFGYDALLLATGSRNRRLPEALTGSTPIHYLRTHDEAARLRAALVPGARLAIIGGGFIGLEVAASAIAAGCSATLLEAGERVLSRGLPAEAAESIAAVHRSRGLEILTGVRLVALTACDGGIALQLADRRLEVDTVVAGIGIVPNVELAEAAGLAVDDGIVVDAACRTSDPHIFAAGEVTRHPSGPRSLRLESWKIAEQQPLTAAAAMTGEDAAFRGTPWLWSDQYDFNLQMIGALDLAAQTRLKGGYADRSWTLVGFDAEARPIGAVAMNAGRDISVLRRAMERGEPLPETFFDPR